MNCINKKQSFFIYAVHVIPVTVVEMCIRDRNKVNFKKSPYYKKYANYYGSYGYYGNQDDVEDEIPLSSGKKEAVERTKESPDVDCKNAAEGCESKDEAAEEKE